MASSLEEGGDYKVVCSVSELQRLGRKRVELDDRVVVLFFVKEKIYALDHFCYHTGGPLELGDIESSWLCGVQLFVKQALSVSNGGGFVQDSHGRLCVVCPWHKHTITLDTGESLYTSIDPSNPTVRKYNVSKGQKQRVHHVKVVDDHVCLKLSALTSVLDSDRYFTDEYRYLIKNVLAEPVLQRHAPAVNVPLHSSRHDLPTPKRY